MPIQYALYENYLTDDPNDFTAHVSPKDVLDMDAVIDRMVERGSTVVRSDILSVLEDYYKTIEIELLQGNFVNTPGCNYSVSIKGIFDGRSDTFDVSRHQIRAVASVGKRVKKTVANQGHPSKNSRIKPSPILDEYVDANSQERNSVLTAGGMGEITGQNLKYDHTDANQGVFFVAGDGTETRVEVVGRMTQSNLMFLVPTLAAGDYTVMVRVLYRESEIRKGELTETLIVS